MKLVLGGINGNYLLNVLHGSKDLVEEVVAAVAYATDTSLLFDWCWSNNIPLRFYGRLDENVAVSLPVLQSFLSKRSPAFACRLVQRHHAKVIWWRGFGLYIGSANLTQSAWYSNVEAGCFFSESEISDVMALEINDLFETLHVNSTPLTEELFRVMKHQVYILGQTKPDAKSFWKEPSVKTWDGLVKTSPKSAMEKRRAAFLAEWHSTLQEIRDIGEVVSRADNRPKWVPDSAPIGAQADQFLHAHYYQRTFDGRKAQYLEHYEKNKGNRAAALNDAIFWWRELKSAPSSEDEMLTLSAPFLQSVFRADTLSAMTLETFEGICSRVHSIRDYSRRVSNASVHLAGGRTYSITEKVSALAARIWNDRSGNGAKVTEQLHYILYEGAMDTLPSRLWDAVSDPNWKIEGLGISALGEIVGWALPDRFPPRNGRTSKALKSLGYNVSIHVE